MTPQLEMIVRDVDDHTVTFENLAVRPHWLLRLMVKLPFVPDPHRFQVTFPENQGWSVGEHVYHTFESAGDRA